MTLFLSLYITVKASDFFTEHNFEVNNVF